MTAWTCLTCLIMACGKPQLLHAGTGFTANVSCQLWECGKFRRCRYVAFTHCSLPSLVLYSWVRAGEKVDCFLSKVSQIHTLFALMTSHVMHAMYCHLCS